MKIYITFGQSHIHKIGDKIFDKDCVAVVETENELEGRNIAFDKFGDEWFTTYTENNWSENKMIYFPRGYVEIDQ